MSWFLLIFSEFNDLMWLIGVQLDQAACPGCSTATTRIWSRLTVKASSLSTTWGQHQDASLLGNMIWVPGWLCIHLFGRIPLILPKTADFTWFDYPPPKKNKCRMTAAYFIMVKSPNRSRRQRRLGPAPRRAEPPRALPQPGRGGRTGGQCCKSGTVRSSGHEHGGPHQILLREIWLCLKTLVP